MKTTAATPQKLFFHTAVSHLRSDEFLSCI